MTFAPCPDEIPSRDPAVPPRRCDGEIIVGSFSTITVPRVDEDGFPILDASGHVRFITLRLQNHRAKVRHWRLDPTGLSPAECQHGLPEHPDGVPLSGGGVSWVRSKYLDVGGGRVTCPVCRGEPAPPDLTTPRNA